MQLLDWVGLYVSTLRFFPLPQQINATDFPPRTLKILVKCCMNLDANLFDTLMKTKTLKPVLFFYGGKRSTFQTEYWHPHTRSCIVAVGYQKRRDL